MTTLLFSGAADAAVRITLLTAAIALVLMFFRIRSSSTRHASWTAVLVAMLLMPVLSRIVPPLSVSIPGPVALRIPTLPEGAIDPIPVQPLESALPAVAQTAAPVDTTPYVPASDSAISAAAAIPWRTIAVATYLAGLAFFLVRLVIGLFHVSQIRRSSRPVILSGSGQLYESASVATPVTIGFLKPLVVLPAGWREWPADMLAAVAAHERAHASRHDPLIAFLSRLNCSVWWFHPVAWWLERELANTAEHACDDVAVRAVTRRRYAEVLLEIAAIVRRHQGRLVWHGVGVDGNGRLGERIDRVLSTTERLYVSRTRRVLVAASCAVVIAAAIACRQVTEVEPLREDPQLAAELKAQRGRSQADAEAQQLTTAEAAALERTLEQNPEDMVARQKLLTFYRWTGKNAQDWNDNVAARRRHALWLIQHHPDSELVTSVRISRREDPAGYGQARKVWLAMIAPVEIDPKILSNAARFFEESEKPVAEEILLRAKAQQPDGPQPRRANGSYYLPWSDRLGQLYATAIMGPVGPYGYVPDSASQAWGRAKLQQSSDPRVLYSAGFQLSWAPLERAFQLELMKRASQLGAPAAREWLRRTEPQHRLEESSAQNATGGNRLRQLASRAEVEYMNAEYSEWRARQVPGSPEYSGNPQKDKEQAAAAFERSKTAAREALDLARSLTATPEYPNAIFRAHIALGLNALREGNRDEAVQHLLDAANGPAPKEPPPEPRAMLEYRLVNYLLKHGERSTVIEYLEREAPRREPAQRTKMVQEAAAVKEGRMPEHYQRLLASGSL